MSQVFVKVDAHGNILCNCDGGVRAAQYTSHSAKNPGREFHRCAKSRDNPAQCGFFAWDDEVVKQSLPSSPPSSPMKRSLSNSLLDSPSILKRPRIDDSPQSPARFPSIPTSKKNRIDEIVQALGQDDSDVFASTPHSGIASTSKYTLNPVKQEYEVEDGLATPPSSLPRRIAREAPPSPSPSRVTPSNLLASITNDFSRLAEEIRNLEEHKFSSKATSNLVDKVKAENRTLKETLRKYEKDIEDLKNTVRTLTKVINHDIS
ncbi:hypothetical protein IW261DRAFT_1452187 [Armillaria novae-zelandiae]|uniref:GRF-type domain-containing protein n=1 Tax=Armillaria novae-zelandiae TaxID=153914 RepID=A0AA39PK75_9AGAR|nr:hypothetical protein IW261DRAFT_1452187 [Armillaria novae-zelandiae]